MKKYLYWLNLGLAAILFAIALVFYPSKDRAVSFLLVWFLSSIGMLIGYYLQIRNQLIIKPSQKTRIVALLIAVTGVILLAFFLLDPGMVQKIVIGTSLFVAAVSTLYFNKLIRKNE